MSKPFWEKRQLKKQEAVILLDSTHSPVLTQSKSRLTIAETLNTHAELGTAFNGDFHKPQAAPTDVAHHDAISVISVSAHSTPRKLISTHDNIFKKDVLHSSVKNINEAVIHADKHSMETISMLDGATTKQHPKRNSMFVNKIMAFAKMKHNSRLSKTDTFDSYVIEDQDFGPLCLIQDSPLRIFKVCIRVVSVVSDLPV
ncbi:hypothetical protein BsWGS_19354 [Bradybaena similaris]